MKETRFKYANSGAMVHRRLVYIYLLNVPSFSSRYFNKIKPTSGLGRLLALSLEILYVTLYGHVRDTYEMLTEVHIGVI